MKKMRINASRRPGGLKVFARATAWWWALPDDSTGRVSLHVSRLRYSSVWPDG